MAEIYIEKQTAGHYHAIREKQQIARGATQNECGCNAKKLYPSDTIMAGRVEWAKHGHPDQFERFYPKC